MTTFTALKGLLDIRSAPSPNETISLFLGRTLEEVSDWPSRPDIMLDGLDRTQCHDAVEARAIALTGDHLMSACVAEMISTLVPLATNMAEVDAAIDMTAQWMTALRTDHLLTRIVDAKREAQDDRIREQNPRELDGHQRRILEGRIEELEQLESDGTLVLSLSGLDAMFTVECDCILVIVQCSPGSDEFLVLYSFEHVEEGGDEDWGGEGDPEPEDQDGPRPVMAA